MSNCCVDHLGNKFRSETAMCKYYGVPLGTYRKRKASGGSTEVSLSKTRCRLSTSPKVPTTSRPYEDHLGNLYPSLVSMCRKYGVTSTNFLHRIKRGWTLEEALCGRTQESKDARACCNGTPSVDYLGNCFKSEVAMCRYHGVTTSTFRSRIERGLSLEEALTATENLNKSYKPCEDHLGNKFVSMAAMCRHYGVTSHQYISRKRLGFSTERALSQGDLRKTACDDGHGKTFDSHKELCQYHGISVSTFILRQRQGKNVHEIVNEWSTVLNKKED